METAINTWSIYLNGVHIANHAAKTQMDAVSMYCSENSERIKYRGGYVTCSSGASDIEHKKIMIRSIESYQKLNEV